MSEYNRNERKDKNYEERYIRREEKRRVERLKRRRRNRIIMVASAAAILAVIILLIILSVNSCLSCSGGETKATDPTEATAATQAATEPATTVKEIADNGETGKLDEATSLYIWNNSAFQLFKGDDTTAKAYASAINKYKTELGSDVKVYDMVVPNHTEFGLCQREAKSIAQNHGSTSQRKNTTTIYNNLSSNVKAVDVYDALNSHKTEYIYFNTDGNWTGLGAYYAYTVFAKSAGITPLQIKGLEKSTINDFLGSFYTQSESAKLQGNPDHIDYYTIPGSYSSKLFMQYSTEATDVDMYYTDAKDSDNAYNVFVWGDNPLMVIDNTGINEGEKIAIVKESYGNAFAPYLAYNYDEVHIIDYRYFDGNLAEYCKENGIKNVLFLNDIISANTNTQIKVMDTIFEANGSGSYSLNSDSSSESGNSDSDSTNGDNSDDSSSDDSQYYYGYDENENSDDSYIGDYYTSEDSESAYYSNDDSGGYDYSYDYNYDYSY